METLRKIGKSNALAPSTLGSEVQKHFSHDPCLKDAMLGILKDMDVFERQDMAEATDAKGRFLNNVTWLRDEFNSLSTMELDDVVQKMELALEGHHTDEDADPGRSPSVDPLEERFELEEEEE